MDKETLSGNERDQIRAKVRARKAKLAAMTPAELFAERNLYNSELGRLTRQVAELKTYCGLVTAELKKRDMPGRTVDVSEHAVVQYLERVEGVDTKAVRRRIREAIPPDAKRNDKFTVDGITYVIAENGRVVTLYKNGEQEPESV